MNRSFSAIFILLMALLLSQSIIIGAQEAKETIIGIVEVYEQDDDGRPILLSIAVYNIEDEFEGDYLVKNEGKGKTLFNHIGDKIKATGIIEMDEDDIYYIEVESFELLSKKEKNRQQEAEEEIEDDFNNDDGSEN